MAQSYDPRVVWGAVIPQEQPVEGPNERCIEIPLALEVMQITRPGRVLDAGCALNGHLADTMQARVYHFTQNIVSETAYAHTDRPLSYVSGDLRDLTLFADGGFDRTVCVSTLEHVGMDNTTYNGPVEACPGSMLKAVKELCRVTKTALLITVPYNQTPIQCAQWRFFDIPAIVQVAKMAFNFGYRIDTLFYGKTAGGWYGGSPSPVEASMVGFPNSVNAMVCLRCQR